MATLEVAIRGRDAEFASGDLVVVHCETGRTAWLTDLEASCLQHLVETLFTDLLINSPRTRYEPGDDIGCLLTALYDGGEGTEVFDASVGAGTEENVIHLCANEFLAWFEAHIIEGFLKAGIASSRDTFRDADTHSRVGAIGDTGFDVGGIEGEFLIKHGVRAALQRLPIRHRLVPVFTLGGKLPTLQISKGGLIRGDKATTGSHLDREVTEGEAALHRERSDNIAGVFNKIACCATGGELRHEIEGDILGGDTLTELAVDGDSHRLGFLLEDTL